MQIYSNLNSTYGTVESTAVYFKNSDVLSTDIKYDTFLNKKSMTRYLCSEPHKVKQTAQLTAELQPTIPHKDNEKFPSNWGSGGTIINLPKGKKHKRMYPINGIDYYYNTFPTVIILIYSVNNFRIYVNNDYFNSNLPTLKIPNNYNVEWNPKEPLLFNYWRMVSNLLLWSINTTSDF